MLMDNNPKVEKCALIIGAFKPYTKGHHFLVTKASEENDVVFVSVSQKDRIRKGEHPITYNKMKIIWDNYIIPILPESVYVTTNDNPITWLYNFLKTIEDSNKTDTVFTLYMDDKDQKRYCYQDNQIQEKFPRLYEAQKIKITTINRQSNINISGTKMRKTLQEKNLEGFKECLPEVLVERANELFMLLS